MAIVGCQGFFLIPNLCQLFQCYLHIRGIRVQGLVNGSTAKTIASACENNLINQPLRNLKVAATKLFDLFAVQS
jgi:hypothetical protein